MSTVFISYRRETAAGEARTLFKDLVAKLGEGSVFMDVDSIALGRDFRTILHEKLESCDLMLVLIDKNWAEVKDKQGRSRLSNPKDFVRMEIEAALKRSIVVTPILVQGATMPDADQLPAEIGDLAYRNGFEITHNRWDSDVKEMIERLKITPPVPSPAPAPPTPKSRQGRLALVAVVFGVAATVVVILYLYLHSTETPEPKRDGGFAQGWVAVDTNFVLANGAPVPAQIPLRSKLMATTSVNVRPGPADWRSTISGLAAGQCFEVEETRALKAGNKMQTWVNGKQISC